eukprot:scaffold125882_cov47-Prasinocladus_malaysianus.AAC.3
MKRHSVENAAAMSRCVCTAKFNNPTWGAYGVMSSNVWLSESGLNLISIGVLTRWQPVIPKVVSTSAW